MTSFNTLKNLLLSSSLLAATSFAAGAFAQPASATVSSRPATSATTATAGDMTEGEVRKVDRAAGKVTLKHSEIKNLDMPAMTMAFQTHPASALASLKTGDKVRFRAEKAGSTVVVTDIRRVK